MEPLSLVRLEDVNGTPQVILSHLPCPLKIGDPIGLRFKIRRLRQGREDELIVDGQFVVTAVGFDAGTMPRKQLLTVESATKPPTWRSVRKTLSERRLAPAIAPRQPVC